MQPLNLDAAVAKRALCRGANVLVWNGVAAFEGRLSRWSGVRGYCAAQYESLTLVNRAGWSAKPDTGGIGEGGRLFKKPGRDHAAPPQLSHGIGVDPGHHIFIGDAA